MQALHIPFAECSQGGIEFSKCRERGNRPKEVVLQVADDALHAAFLVALGRSSKVDFQGERSAELRELGILDAAATTQDPDDGGLGVIEDGAQRQAAQHDESSQQTREQRNLVAAQRGACKVAAAVAEPDREKLHDGEHAGQIHFDRREIELRLVAGSVARSHKRLFGDQQFPATSDVFAKRTLIASDRCIDVLAQVAANAHRRNPRRAP